MDIKYIKNTSALKRFMIPIESGPQHIGIAINPSYEWYCRNLAANLRQQLPDIEVRWTKFENDMPLVLVGEADHVIMPAIINGDNWDKSLIELMATGNALTYDQDSAGRNCKRLSIFLSMADLRQDGRTRKPVPDSIDMAIVKKQFVFTKILASILKHTAGADDVTGMELHSHQAYKEFQNEGMDVMNISTMGVFADRLTEDPNILDGKYPTIIGSTDFGDLNRAVPLQRLLNLPVAVVEKTRIASENGTMSEIRQKLIFGDPKGKRVIIIDDMVSGGNTLKDAVNLYESLGAEEFIIFITHPIYVGNYYENIQQVLRNPKVKMLMVTNTIPFATRFSGTVSNPYIGKNENQKSVETLDLNQLQIEVMKAILNTSSLQEAKKKLGRHVWDMQDPFELACQVTGLSIKKPQDNYIYQGGGDFVRIIQA